MSGIMGSARIIRVKATCGHEAMVDIPPCNLGNIGPVGRRNIATTQARPCWNCRMTEEHKAALHTTVVRGCPLCEAEANIGLPGMAGLL